MSESVTALSQFYDAVLAQLPSQQVITDYATRYALSTDASFYRMTPKYVVVVKDLAQAQYVIQCAAEAGVHITFRAAGTSLSGQAISDSVLMMLSDDWQDYSIADNGAQITLSPSIIGAKANQLLAPYGRKIGPDPASINTCKVGGIAANNASGMCCGVKNNTYHTVADMTLVFADGTVLNTADEQSRAEFIATRQTWVKELEQLAQSVRENKALSERIVHKYRLKNTTGYGLNALVDYTDAIDILKHLVIGSEGTLAFIAQITYNTVEDRAFKHTGLFTFTDATQACALIEALHAHQVEAVEMLDKRALMSVRDHAIMPQGIEDYPEQAVALLIDIASDNQEQLDELSAAVSATIARFEHALVHQYPLDADKARAAALWNVRKGTFPAVGAVRDTGTTVIIEDVAFELKDLAAGIEGLHTLFNRYGYDEAIIFGHALAGNLHFVFTQAFDSDEEVARYEAFMEDVAQLVAVKFGGSLKAEHGTGRNMAPYIALEWGDEGYAVMEQIKALFDPQGILNPGVIINDDPQSHVKNLKAMPASDEQIDTCIECGFCEPVCPSKEYTLTPRQRISLKRHEQQLQAELAAQPNNTQVRQQLENVQSAYQHQAIDSCAATGVCATRCPVGINTGEYIKSLRHDAHQQSTAQQSIARKAADHFSAVSSVARVGLNVAKGADKLLPKASLQRSSQWLHDKFGTPLYYSAWPKGQQKTMPTGQAATEHKKKVVYVPSCANRIFDSSEERSLQQVFYSLCEKTGYEVVIPQKLDDLCCGMPFQSRGAQTQAKQKQQQLLDAIDKASEQGRFPIVMDASPCALQTNKAQQHTVLDSMTFAQQYLVNDLNLKQSDDELLIHITCSSQHLDGGQSMLAMANRLSTKVSTTQVSCCGFAGDKGFTLPELNEHALRNVQQKVPQGCSKGYSNSRTCEIGLSEHSGVPFSHLLFLLDEQSSSV